MNEQLLKFVYDGSEKDGFALVGAQFKTLVDELVDSELVEVDPAGAQPDGSYRVTVTDNGIKWVEAGQATAKVIAETATIPAPARPRGRPRKAAAMEVISEGPIEAIESELVDEPLPFTLPPTMTNTQRLSEPLDGRPFEIGDSRAPVPAWGDKVAQQPAPFVSPFDVTPSSGDVFADIGVQKPAWSHPPVMSTFQPFNGPQTSPIEEEHFHQPTPQPLAEVFKPLIEAEKPVEGPLRPRREMNTTHLDENGMIVRTGLVPTNDPVQKIVESYIQSDNVYKQPPSVGITTHLVPPTKRVRIKAEDRLAPWPQFAQMPVYGQFYLTDEQVADGFDDVLKTANRVYGKQTPAKTFQMFEAKKVQNANTTVGFFVFRMS